MNTEDRSAVSIMLLICLMAACVLYGQFLTDHEPYTNVVGVVVWGLACFVFATCMRPFRCPRIRQDKKKIILEVKNLQKKFN